MKALVWLLKAVTWLIFVAVCTVWSGWVLIILWGWFVVPVFHLPPLELAPAVGVALIVSYLTHQFTDQSSVALTKMNVFLAAKPSMALLLGWIIKQWM